MVFEQANGSGELTLGIGLHCSSKAFLSQGQDRAGIESAAVFVPFRLGQCVGQRHVDLCFAVPFLGIFLMLPAVAAVAVWGFILRF